MTYRFRWVAAATSAAIYALIVVGNVVRVTGSGLGCPDWPLCHGHLIPPLEGPTLLEYSHRLVSTLVTVLMLATAFLAWRWFRHRRWIFGPVMLAIVLLGVQIVLGGITVVLELPPAVVAVHLGNALLLFACVLTAATVAFLPTPARIRPAGSAAAARSDAFPRIALAAAAAAFVIVVSGAFVTGSDAGLACTTWPLCNGGIMPRNALEAIQLGHRTIVGLGGLVILAAAVSAWRMRRDDRAIVTAAALAVVFLGIQVLLGAANVLLLMPVWLRAAHLATATAVWASLVVMTVLAYQAAAVVPEPARPEQALARRDGRPQTARSTISHYVALTKPWIVLLLLVTTFGAMLVAQRGFPPLGLMTWTLLGGALAAGGASALNSYVDRDIDVIMFRTSRRPLPAGLIEPRNALVFGLVLCALSVLILGLAVNWLSAGLALAGIVYYVVIYTLWLKRTTPHNIVIGGAAGAIPPLVGWAAVTNQISLLAMFLFAIIFFWTPPHTWALVLMVDKDYHRAGVPMLPVVRGDSETRRQILLYSIVLVVVSLIPVPTQMMGWIYFAAAALLGVWLLRLAAVLMRDGTKSEARKLYRYSTYYLALLFLVMVIDRWRPS